MLAGVIFDLDGVVVDSHPAHLKAWKELLERLGRKTSERDLEFVLEGHRRDAILRHFLGDLTAEQLKDYGERKDALYRQAALGLKTINGLEEFLCALERAGVSMAVASSAARQRVEHTLETLGLAHRFRTVVAGDDVQNHKPDPAAFQLAAQGLGVEPERVLVCEDAVVGVMGAKRAGMKCVGVGAEGRANKLIEAGADWVVKDFTQVGLNQVRQLFAGGQ